MRLRVFLPIVLVVTVLVVGGVYLGINALTSGITSHLPITWSPRSASSPATYEGQPETVDRSPEQMANAATIAAVGITRRVPARAIVVALATAQQESKLYNLEGGDRDSIGLFQQRPSQGWGTGPADRRPAVRRRGASTPRCSR